MNRSKRTFLLSVSLCLLAACAAPATGAPAADIDQLNTFVAETAISAKTQSAVPGTSTPIKTITSTSTFGSQPSTPMPTLVLPPTSIVPFTPAIPIISVSVATNCRNGPGKIYAYEGALLVGQVAEVLAREPSGSYWYIQNPESPGDFCWLWGKYATISGNTLILPIYTPPPTPTPTVTPLPTFTPTPGPGIQISYSSMDTCSAVWWVEFKLNNKSDINLRSLEIKVLDLATQVALSNLSNGFTNIDGCLTSTTTDVLMSEDSAIVSAPAFAYNPHGHEIELTVTACGKTGQSGLCIKRRIQFVP